MLGLRETYLSAVTKVSAGQKLSSNHLTPNILYMMLWAALFCHFSISGSLGWLKFGSPNQM
jgi:hypothetical protein